MAEQGLNIIPIETFNVELNKPNRWICELPKRFDIVEWSIKEVSPLKYARDEKTGKYKWDDVVITIRDLVCPNPSQKLSNLIQSKKFKDFDFTVKMLGPVGDEVEVRTYEGCTIKEFDFGKTDYTCGDEFNEIKLIIETNNVIIY